VRANPDVAFEAVKRDARVLKHVAEPLRSNPAFIARCAEANILVLGQVPPAARGAFAAAHPPLARSYTALMNQVKALDIERLDRFHDEAVLREVVRVRTEPPGDDDRPLAVLIYAKSDESGALKKTQIDELMQSHRVAYFEADEDTDLAAIYEAAGGPASLVVLAGHGTRDHLALGEGDPAEGVSANEARYIDLSDGAQLKGLELAPGAQVVLRSCSTGSGAADRKNLANMLAELYPEAHVWAPREPINNMMRFDDAGRFVDPGYSGGRGVTYHIAPATD